jgi:hypothetical protein
MKDLDKAEVRKLWVFSIKHWIKTIRHGHV